MRRSFLSILMWAYWTVCFHICLMLTFVLFIFTYPFDRYRKIPNRALKLLAWLILKPVPSWTFNITGADPNKVEKPTIVVANHQSFLDIPLLYLLPWDMKWVTKKSLMRIPVLGWLTAMTGSHSHRSQKPGVSSGNGCLGSSHRRWYTRHDISRGHTHY